MEASGASPAWQFVARVDIGEVGPETLAEIDASWRAKWWLEVAIEGIQDEEVPWHDLLTLLTSGAEGTTKALAKCQVATWRWNIKVWGKECAHPHPLLNISKFLTDQEMGGGLGKPHWFVAYSRMLQRVGEAEGSGMHGESPWRSKPPHWCVPFGVRLMWT